MRRENAISIPIVITFALSALLLACATSHIQPPANAQPNQPATTKSKSEVASGNLPLRVLADVQLSGGTTRFDYQSLDSSSGRLYIAHLGSDLMTVFDVNKQAVIGDVNDIKRVHGVLAEIDPSSDQVVAGYPFTGCKGSHGLLIDSERRLAFAACEDNSKLVVFDLESKTATATLAVGADPDVLALTRACDGFTCQPKVALSQSLTNVTGAYKRLVKVCLLQTPIASRLIRAPIVFTFRCKTLMASRC